MFRCSICHSTYVRPLPDRSGYRCYQCGNVIIVNNENEKSIDGTSVERRKLK